MNEVYYKKMIEGQNIINQVSNPKKYIAFFDIDDTLLDTSGNIIIPMYNLYTKALQKGITIVIITARAGFSGNMKRTIDELQSNNISYTLLYLRPPENTNQNFKKFCRKNAIEITGLTPLFSVGDQPWDCFDFLNDSNIYSGYPLLLK